jgi:hypothetical protein
MTFKVLAAAFITLNGVVDLTTRSLVDLISSYSIIQPFGGG